MRIPIRLRLTLIFATGMAVVFAGLGTLVYLRTGADLVASVDTGLRSRAQVLTDAVRRAEEGNIVRAPGTLIDPDEAFAQILDGSGRVIDASSAVRDAALLDTAQAGSVREPIFVTRQIGGFDDPVRLLAVAVERPGRRAVVVVGATLGDMNDALARLLVAMITIGPLALLVTAGAGWLLAGAALRPVESMRREAAAISASEPARRLPIPATGDELARLATTLNAMLDRLQEALERGRRFVDDASHELRTPLASLRGEIGLALARHREAPELEAALRSIREDVERLERLAEDLLVLARSRGGRVPVRRVPAPLADLVARSVRAVEEPAAAAGVQIEVDGPDAIVTVDPDRVQQALRNLLENAVRHAPSGGVVRLVATRVEDSVRFVVSDSGPGFPPGLIDRAFEPFARGDGAASDPDGTGLGLAIVRAVAEAHGGSVWADNDGGARVTLTLLA